MKSAKFLLVVWCIGFVSCVDNKENSIDQDALPRWIYLLHDKDPKVREETAYALARLGPQAKKAIPYLVEALSDDELAVRLASAKALGGIGTESVPALTNVLTQSEQRVQEHGPNDLRPLAHTMHSSRATNAREGAAIALGIIGPPAKDAVSTLVLALNDKDAGVRLRSAEALGKIGLAAESAVPSLLAASKDEDSGVRKAAKIALTTIRSIEKKTIE